MSRRQRALLAALALLLLFLAASALLYAARPNPLDGAVFPVPTALLIPPGAAP